MKTTIIFCMLVLLSLCYSKSNAQDITISSGDFVNLKIELQQQKDSINTLKKKIETKDSLLKSEVKSYNELASLCSSMSSKIDSLENANEELQNLSNKMLNMQKSVDESNAKLANGRLYFKYSDDLVQSSVQILNGLKTDDVKKRFEQALQLLRNYKSYSEDVKNTLIELQSINRDLWRSKYHADEYRRKCFSILSRSIYYQQVYTKKTNGSWTIPYLDNLINAAKSIIKKHNPAESEFAIFSPLIEML